MKFNSTILFFIFLIHNSVLAQDNANIISMTCEADFVSSLINAEVNEVVTFSEVSTNANNFNWAFTPNASVPFSNEENPGIFFNQIGATSVELLVTSDDGCVNSITKQGPNIVSATQSIDDCWTIINNGEDIYNGQYTYAQFPGYHDPEVMDIAQVQDGFIACGHYNNQIFDSQYGVNYTGLENKNGSYLTKYNRDGLLKWVVFTEKSGNSDRDVMYSTVEDGNGNIYVAGHSRGVFYDNFGNSVDFSAITTGGFILKLNSEGRLIWHIKTRFVYAKRLHIDGDNSLIVSGDISGVNAEKKLYLNDIQTEVLYNYDSVDVNRFFLKLDSNGSLQWHTGIKTTGPNSEFLEDIGHDSNNNLYLTGYCSFNASAYSANNNTPNIISFSGNSPKLFLIKFDASGQIVWITKSYVDNPSYGEGVIPRSIITDNNGNSYVTGHNDNYNSNYNQVFENTDGSITSEGIAAFFIAKINSNGICEWIRGASDVLYGGGSKIIKSGNEIIAVGSVSNNSTTNPLTSVEFLSTDGNNLQTSFYPWDYFLTVYDEDGNLKRIVTNGINTTKPFSRRRISGFFKDDNNNYYLSRNIEFLLFGLQSYENFSHTIEASDIDGIDGTITKFTEDCGIVIYNTINQNIPDFSVCDDTSIGTDSDGLIVFNLLDHEENIINGQAASNYEISYYTDPALINEITDPTSYENTDPIETIFINVEFLINEGNSFQTSYLIEVVQSPTVTSEVTLNQCDENSDGYTIFNLTNSNSVISQNYLSETITFYESQFNAENEIEAIEEPTEYPNETMDSDIVWARVENENGCYATSQVNLIVSDTQIPDTYFREFYECDALMSIHDGISVFDFSIVNSEIELMFPNGQNLNISYHESLSDAYGNLNAIQDISNYTNTTPIAQDIYVRVVNPLNSECLGIGHYITLHVVEMPLVTGPLLIEECDYDDDGLVEFSTSSFEYLLSDSQTIDVSFRYYDEEGNELPSPLPDPYITSEPITNIMVSIIAENQNISSGGCEVTTGIALFINSDYNIGEVPNYFGCLNTSDSYFTFDTSNLESSILNGQSDLEISYFDENSNLIESPFPNEYSLSESATVKAIITNTQDPMLCPMEIDIHFELALKPDDIQIDDIYLCFEEGEDKIFYLREYLDASLDEYDITNSEINAYDNGALYDDIINLDFQNLNQVEINYRIENANFPECYSMGSFNIISSSRPTIGDLSDIILCDDESNDGFENLDLQSISEEILIELSTSQYTISFFESYDSALENINPIQQAVIGTSDDQTIYIRVSSQENIDCYDISDFNLVVKPVPDISEIQNEYYICKGESLIVTVGDGLDYYFWSNGITTSSLTITEAGEYSITALRDYPAISCEITKTFVVYESEEPSSVEIVVINESITSSDIEIITSGIGDYEYSLDGVIYQESNIFYDLTQSDYTIYVRDQNGCGVYIKELFLLRYPKFFTPNNDTENDYWQLYNANKEPLNKLYIFDRYGKLLIELGPRSVGWDGTYNGLRMPNNDYWFMLERQNGKTYTGHFALIR
jgi:gliding motility-associated-like protein